MQRSVVKARLAAFAGLAALALGALAISPQPAQDILARRLLGAVQRAGGLIRDIGTMGLALPVGAGIVLLCVALVLRMLDRKSGRADRIERYWKPARRVLFSLLILAVAFWSLPWLAKEASRAAGLSATATEAEVAPSAAPASASGLSAEGGGPEIENPTNPMLGLAALLGGALLMGGGLALVLAARRGRHVEGEVHDTAALAAAAAEAAAREAARRARKRLELGDAMRDAIVDCYASMCAIFSQRLAGGGPRSESLTAREIADRLSSLGAREAEIRLLTAIFEKARYSGEECDAGDRAAAIAALSTLEARYEEAGR